MHLSTSELLAMGERTIVSGLDIKRDLLPPSYRGKRKYRPMPNVIRQAEKRAARRKTGRERSVKWHNNREEIFEATSERLAVLAKYAKNVENGEDIAYDIDELKLHKNQIAFANVLGLMKEE